MKPISLSYLMGIALLVYSNSNAQKLDFIVTNAHDTIYVDKISLTDFEVKTKTDKKKKTYKVDEIIAYHDAGKNKNYERVKNQTKNQAPPSEADRYDYRKLENAHAEAYKNIIEYKFIQRLTDGKVKLFTEGGRYMSAGSPNSVGMMYDDTQYYISIFDSKPEPINNYGKLDLNSDVYEILKIYLQGNTEIRARLDQLYKSKPIAKEKEIVDLVNEYNVWAKSNK